MRILKVELKNFYGLKLAMNRDELKIDFKKYKNKIFLLRGGNGSGKTFLLSVLHPFFPTFDGRDIVIDPEKEKGYKNIVFKDGNDVYECELLYNKTANKAYIKKNGEELNPNGNITSYKDYVRDNLGLIEEYFSVLRIGDNVNTFVDSKYTERKKFISLLISNIDDFLSAFKIVSEKMKQSNALLKVVSSKLNNLPDKEFLEAQNKLLVSDINKLKKELKEKEKNLNLIEYKLKDVKFEDVDINEEKRKIFKLKTENSSLNIKNRLILTNLPDIPMKIDNVLVREKIEKEKLKIIIEQNESKLTTLQDDINNKSKEKEEISKELLDFEDYQEDTLNKEIKNYEKKLKEYDYLDDYKKILENPKFASKSLESFFNNKEIEEFKRKINLINENYKNIVSTLTEYSYNDNKNLLNDVSVNLIKKTREQADLEAKVLEEEKNYSLFEKLKLRPEECIIDHCAFIKDSLKYSNLDEKLSKDRTLLNKTKKEVEKLTTQKSELEENIKKIKTLVEQLKEVLVHKDYCEIFQIKDLIKDSIETSYLFNKSNRMRSIFIDLEKLNSLFINYINRKKYEEKLVSFKKMLESALREKKTLENLKKKEKKLMNEYSIFSDDYDTLWNKNLQQKETLTKVEKKINDLSNLIENYNTIDTNKKIIEEKEKILTSYEEYRKEREEFEGEKENLLEKKNDLEEKIEDKETNYLEKNKADLLYIEQYKKELKELKENYSNYKDISKALDIKTGIPLIFTKNYIEEIKNIANKLLKMAFKNFELDFVINDKEFVIPVSINNIETGCDILTKSQGEKAIVKIAISLAIIERALSKYNIVYLDEIDGTLEEKNRRIFIDILEKQIDVLGIEQVFIISHNDEFNSSFCNIINMNDLKPV